MWERDTDSFQIRSTWYGWGILCVAGGGAYYFAKKQVNADRQSRFEEDMKKKSRLARLESSHSRHNEPHPKAKSPHTDSSNGKSVDHAGDPSSEGSEDAAPVGHAPINPEQRVREKSKYEAAEPYRSKKGDRFS